LEFVGKHRLIGSDIAEFTIGDADISKIFCYLGMTYRGKHVASINASLISVDFGASLGKYNGNVAPVVIRDCNGNDIVRNDYEVDHRVVIDGPGEVEEYVSLSLNRVGRVEGSFVVYEENGVIEKVPL
jgi:hypothetical protein